MSLSFVRARVVAVLIASATAIAPSAASAADKDADAIAVPDGSPAELLEFIAKVQERQAAGSDRVAVNVHLMKVQGAVIAAAEKIVAAKPNETQLTAAVSAKLAALVLLRRIDAPQAEARLKSYLDEVAKDPRPFIPPLGKIHALATRLQQLDIGNHAEVEKFVDDMREHVRTAEPDAKNLSLAYQTALAAERAGLLKLAAEAYVEFAAAFAKSGDSAVAEKAKLLEGAGRLLALPGKTIDVTGKQLDGTPIDWAKYRGKTVLVVFWATWCGPCVAELPVLKDIYAKYQDRGFEVVSVSLDFERQRLDDFVKREDLKWPVLYGDDKATAGWNHPLAQHYGVMRLPRSILVDKTGNVVSIDAHGEVLFDLLAKQIGPAVVKEKEPAAEGDKPATPAPGEAKPGDAKPGDAKPGEAKPERKP